MKKTFIILICFSLFLACKHTIEDDSIEPEIIESSTSEICDTTNIKFKNIVRIMDIHCNSVACHSEVTRAGDIALEQYNDIKKYTLNGDIYRTITLQEDEFLFMPEGAEALTTCEIEKIKIWAKNDAPK